MLERSIGLLGLVAILGIAYAASNNRRAIKLRTVAWGLALQMLFAVTILGDDLVSFAGMFLFVFLIVLYLFEAEVRESGRHPWLIGALTFVGSAAVVVVAHTLFPAGVTPWLLGAAVVALIAGWVLKRPHLARPALAVALLLGVGMLWARGIDGEIVFQVLGDKVTAFLSLALLGSEFLFGNLVKSEYFFPGPDAGWPGFGFQFAFAVLPTIIFFSAVMSILYYYGILQRVVAAMARFMGWTMGTSGAETVSCSANVFVGQTEAPFLIKPFLPEMTISELHAVMVGGFATIAGGVMAGYIQMGVDASSLIAASVMAAPAALVMSKIFHPETEISATAGNVEVPEVETADNVLDAAAAGTTDGLKLALNVGAMLIAFIALIGVVDLFLGAADRLIDGWMLGGPIDPVTQLAPGIFPGNLKTLLGTLLAPLAWLMGVPRGEASAVGNLLGIKLAANEFVAYSLLTKTPEGELSRRSILIATFALCGFANFSSIGIQIGGISALAPERRSDLARIGLRAMFAGALTSCLTATIAGILMQEP